MQKTLIKLLSLQIFLLVSVAGAAVVFAGKSVMPAMLAGGSMSIAATLFALFVFRRLPDVMPTRVFLGAMVVSEIGKWVIVILLAGQFVRHHPPLWVLLGFMATYSAYFWILLIDRG